MPSLFRCHVQPVGDGFRSYLRVFLGQFAATSVDFLIDTSAPSGRVPRELLGPQAPQANPGEVDLIICMFDEAGDFWDIQFRAAIVEDGPAFGSTSFLPYGSLSFEEWQASSQLEVEVFALLTVIGYHHPWLGDGLGDPNIFE